MTDLPTAEPREITQSDTAVWLRDLGSEATPATHTLKYRISGTGTDADLVAQPWADDPNIFAIQITSAQSLVLGVGENRLSGWLEWSDATFGAQRRTIFDGALNVIADPATATDADIGHVRRMLEAIEATLEGTATAGQKRYAIRDRSLERMDLKELTDAREYYKRRLKELEDSEAAKRGERRSNMIGVSFGLDYFLPPGGRYR